MRWCFLFGLRCLLIIFNITVSQAVSFIALLAKKLKMAFIFLFARFFKDKLPN